MPKFEIRLTTSEKFFEEVRKFAYSKGRPLAHILHDALTKYMEEDEAKRRQKAIENRFLKNGTIDAEPRRRRRRERSLPVEASNPEPIPPTVKIVGDAPDES